MRPAPYLHEQEPRRKVLELLLRIRILVLAYQPKLHLMAIQHGDISIQKSPEYCWRA
jgi:hypothetical protein